MASSKTVTVIIVFGQDKKKSLCREYMGYFCIKHLNSWPNFGLLTVINVWRIRHRL